MTFQMNTKYTRIFYCYISMYPSGVKILTVTKSKVSDSSGKKESARILLISLVSLSLVAIISSLLLFPLSDSFFPLSLDH